MVDESNGIHIGTRVPQKLYSAIVRRQKEIGKRDGFEPSISAMIRKALEATYGNEKRR